MIHRGNKNGDSTIPKLEAQLKEHIQNPWDADTVLRGKFIALNTFISYKECVKKYKPSFQVEKEWQNKLKRNRMRKIIKIKAEIGREKLYFTHKTMNILLKES